MSKNTPLLARQPIYDGDLNIVAYELLFRSSGSVNQADFIDGDKASSQVILNAFTSLPIGELLEGLPAYVNFTKTLLNTSLPISKKNLVIEVLESVEIDIETIDDIQRLKAQGFTIALDDYIFDPAHHELLMIVDIIKLDVLEQSLDAIAAQIELLKTYQLILLAEKVETHEMFVACRELGCSLFQGYFLSKPQIIEGRETSTNQRAVLRLFSALEDPEVEFDVVVGVITVDPSLTFRLLRLINSAYFNIGKKIESLHKAIAMLGLTRIKSLARLLALGGMDSKPKALHLIVLARARMCQLMAETMNGTNRDYGDKLFTIGLLSTLDAYFDMDLQEVLSSINLDNELQQAILVNEGQLGLLLSTVKHFEKADFAEIDWTVLKALGLDAEMIERNYIESAAWAAENVKFLL